jgi:hypothetical protein
LHDVRLHDPDSFLIAEVGANALKLPM